MFLMMINKNQYLKTICLEQEIINDLFYKELPNNLGLKSIIIVHCVILNRELVKFVDSIIKNKRIKNVELNSAHLDEKMWGDY